MKKAILTVLFTLAYSVALLVSFASSAYSSPPEYESAEDLNRHALEYIKQKIDQKIHLPKIEFRTLSENLKLPKCSDEPQISDRNPDVYAGRMTLSLSCQNPAWRIFIPVKVEGDLQVVVATQGILKNAVIEQQDVAYQYRPFKEVPRDSNVSLEQAIGMRAKQNIGAGKILTLNYLSPPYWVRKNQPITLVSNLNGIEVKAAGTALEDGVEKETVTVKNAGSGKQLKGIVIAPNTVYIP
ncbi:flagellar basal body P-ring formation chaperone FlgA [Thiomicrorhabdus sp.]|uniref:flagellar basal body P-ring formation chaperone FlgA n=1 Tax=Thiomicrorhabdus sp. TaxID=2039724 RepID=UPI0029C716F4|nr:flagellar basal body P-ring formation chaperone FlgA [Thiomicrorhabdus sp.]